MDNNLKYLSNLAIFITQRIEKAAINNEAKKFGELQSKICEKAEDALTWISNNITNSNYIRENTV
jgi:hypothetical protein